jgi:uncharacterized RDD family membrane protein YckC
LAYCASCGRELPVGATFCPACGKPVTASAAPGMGPQPQGYSNPAMSNLASVGDRIVAIIIDTIILVLISSIIFVPLFILGALGNFGFFLFFFPVVFLPWLFGLLYFTYFEATTGQTPGKSIVKIRTVDAKTLKPLDFARSFVRNLLRIIDALPFLYLLGLILIATNKKRQRIGDMAADSIVIKA